MAIVHVICCLWRKKYQSMLHNKHDQYIRCMTPRCSYNRSSCMFHGNSLCHMWSQPICSLLIHKTCNVFVVPVVLLSNWNKVKLSWGEGLHRSFATPNPFVLTNKICLNQIVVRALLRFVPHPILFCFASCNFGDRSPGLP